MRDNSDLIRIEVVIGTSVSLDWERILQDPAWIEASLGFDLDDPDGRQQALYRYVGRYLGRERLLTECPATNGPSDIWVLDMEDLQYGARSSISSNDARD